MLAVEVEAAQRGRKLLHRGAGVVHRQRHAARIGPHVRQPQPPLRRRRLLHLLVTRVHGNIRTHLAGLKFHLGVHCGFDSAGELAGAGQKTEIRQAIERWATGDGGEPRVSQGLIGIADLTELPGVRVCTSVKTSFASASRPCSASTAPTPLAAYTLPAEHDHQLT